MIPIEFLEDYLSRRRIEEAADLATDSTFQSASRLKPSRKLQFFEVSHRFLFSLWMRLPE